MVRRARVEDAEAIARVMATVAEEGSIATEPPVDIAARAQTFRGAIEAEGPAALWVLEEEGRVVGNAGVQESGAPGVLSLGMAVLPEVRGRGGGRALLEAVLEHGRSSGAHKLELEAWPDNPRAIALYASAGFEVEGLRRDHYRRRDGTLRPALLMARRLGAASPRASGEASDAREHPNAALVRRFHALQGAFYGGGPIEPLRELLAEDVRWRVPGRSAIAGDYSGRDEVLSYFERRRELARARFRLEVREVVATGELVFQLVGGTVERAGESRPWETVGVLRVGGERIRECWLLPFDQYLFDEIWS